MRANIHMLIGLGEPEIFKTSHNQNATGTFMLPPFPPYPYHFERGPPGYASSLIWHLLDIQSTPEFIPKAAIMTHFCTPHPSDYFTPPTPSTHAKVPKAIKLNPPTPHPSNGTRFALPRARKLMVDTSTVERCICHIWEHRGHLFHLYEGRQEKVKLKKMSNSNCLIIDSDLGAALDSNPLWLVSNSFWGLNECLRFSTPSHW